MFKLFVVLLGILGLGFGTAAEAADEVKPPPYVGKIMLEIIVSFPKEFERLDERTKNELKQHYKDSGAQDCENGMRMPMVPLRGAWLKVGKQIYMTDANGDFAVPSLPAGTTEIPIYQQLSDPVPMAKYPVKRLNHRGEKLQPLIISIRNPIGECHSGKIESVR